MVNSSLYQYFFNHLKEEEIEEESDKKEEPTDSKSTNSKEDKRSASSTNSAPSDVKAIVQKEVKKALTSERTKMKKEAELKAQQQRSADYKKPTLKSKKSANHKQSNSKETKQPQSVFNPSEQLTLLNLSYNTPQRLSSIYEDKFQKLMKNTSNQFFIFSVCMKQRTMRGCKHLTELFQKELIENDFCYLPIYALNSRRQISDIMFVVFNVQRRDTAHKKTFSELTQFITAHSDRYGIGSVISFENGKYYQITEKKLWLQSNDFQRILLHYLYIRGYQKESFCLYYWGKTEDLMTERFRFKQNEIVI